MIAREELRSPALRTAASGSRCLTAYGIGRAFVLLLLAAFAVPSIAQIETSTIVWSDSAGRYCSDPVQTTCSFIDANGDGFFASASATASLGSAGVRALFTMSNLLVGADDENYSFAQASWVEGYLVPAAVTHMDFRFHVTGDWSLAGPRDTLAAHLTMTAGEGDFNGGNDVFAVASLLSANVPGGVDILIGIDRFESNYPDDRFALPFTHSLEALVVIEPSSVSEFVSGQPFADYAHTVTLVSIDLYGANGRITDLATVSGTSGRDYAVTGFVGAIPEPSTYVLMLLGLAGLTVAMRQARRRENRSARAPAA